MLTSRRHAQGAARRMPRAARNRIGRARGRTRFGDGPRGGKRTHAARADHGHDHRRAGRQGRQTELTACTGTSAAGALELATSGSWSGAYFSGLGYSVETILGETHEFEFGAPGQLLLELLAEQHAVDARASAKRS